MLTLQAQLQRLTARYQDSKLLKSGVWYLIGTFGQQGIAFIGVFVFSRLMTPEEYGTVSIFLSWVAIFASVLTLNVYGAISPAKYDYDESTFKRFVSASTVLGTVVCAGAVVLTVLLPETVSISLFNMQRLYVLCAIGVTIGDLWSTSLLTVWNMEYRYRAYAVARMTLGISKFALPAILILVAFGGDNAFARVIGTTAASLVLGMFFLRTILLHGKTLYDRRFWRYALVYGVPLIPHALSGFILSHFDRILIDRYIGRDEAGLYTFAYQIGEITTMLWYASNTAWVPYFFEQMSKGNFAELRRRSSQYMILFAIVSGLAMIAGPLIIHFFGGPEYQVAKPLVPLIMGSQFFTLLYSLYVNVEFYEKKTAFISVGTALAAVVNLLLNIWWLPIYGYAAAAWSTLISYVLLFLFHYALVRYRLKSSYNTDMRVVVGLSGVMIIGAVAIAVSLAT